VDDPELDVDVIAAALRADGAEAGDLMDLLGTKLEGAVPGCIEVKRSGGLFSRKKTVDTITAAFADAHYVLVRQKHGPVASRAKVVRGVKIATREIPMTDWVAEVARELQRIGATNADARRALQRLVLGE
jgi:hypothetical protein